MAHPRNYPFILICVLTHWLLLFEPKLKFNLEAHMMLCEPRSMKTQAQYLKLIWVCLDIDCFKTQVQRLRAEANSHDFVWIKT